MSRRRKLLFFFLVQLFAFGAIEVGTRIYYAVGDRVPPTPDRSLEREWMWVERHRKAGVAAFPSEHVFDAEVGWRNTPGLATDLVRTNSAGMRNEREFALDPKGRRRIVFVGDSYTFGPFVGNGASFVGHIGAALADTDVLNFAVSGHGTDQAQLTYEHTARDYGAQIVVMGYYVRDYTRNLVTFSDYAKPRFVVDGDGLRLEGDPVIAPEALLAQYAAGERRVGHLISSYAIDALRRSLSRLDRHDMAGSADGWRVLSRLMARFDAAVRADGATPVWLVIPARDIVGGSSKFDPLAARCMRRAEKLGMAAFDAGPVFAARARADPAAPLYRPSADGGHLSADGNALLAEAFLGFLRQQGLIP